MKKMMVLDCFGEVTEVLYGHRGEFVAHFRKHEYITKLNDNTYILDIDKINYSIQCDHCFEIIKNTKDSNGDINVFEDIVHVFEGHCYCNSCWSLVVNKYDLRKLMVECDTLV